jgi:hypothetical protein
MQYQTTIEGRCYLVTEYSNQIEYRECSQPLKAEIPVLGVYSMLFFTMVVVFFLPFINHRKDLLESAIDKANKSLEVN